MFKNVMVYRIGPDWSASLAQMEEQLQKARFVACGAASNRRSAGSSRAAFRTRRWSSPSAGTSC